MLKFTKIILTTLLSFFLLAILAVLAITFLINPNNLKPAITKAFFNQTGQRLSIEGKITWSIFPSLSLKVDKLSIKNPPNFLETNLATLKEADFQVELLPLFHHQIQVGTLTIKGLTLNLLKNSNGECNWQNLFNNRQSKNSESKQVQNSKYAIIALTISKINIIDTNLHLQNLATNQNFDLTNLTFNSTQIGVGKNFPVQLNTEISLSNPASHGKLNLTGYINIDPAKQIINFANVKIQGQINNKQLTKPSNLQANLTGFYNLKKQNYQISGPISVNQIVSSTFQIGKINSKLIVKNNFIALNPFRANLYGGKYLGNIQLNSRKNNSTYQLQGKLVGLQTGLLYKTLAPNSHFALIGKANLTENLTTSDNEAKSLIQNLNGLINIEIKNGALKGIDIKRQIELAASLLNNTLANQTTNINQTTFSLLKGSIYINQGVASNSDLSLISPTLLISGKGQVNLINKNINYRLLATIQNSGIKKFEQFQDTLGGAIPLRISGTYDAPHVTPDQKVIVKAIAKSYLEKNASKISEAINKNVSGLGSMLQQQFHKLLK